MISCIIECIKDYFSGTLILDVTLDTTQDPPVIISQMDADATGRKIQWNHNDLVNAFEFKQINALNQVYFPKQSIDPDRKTIRCSNKAPADPSPNAAYWYEIVVTLDDVNYKSTKNGVPPGGEPVIRNS